MMLLCCVADSCLCYCQPLTAVCVVLSVADSRAFVNVSVADICVNVCVTVSCALRFCEDKFMQKHGVVRLWQVVRSDFILPRN